MSVVQACADAEAVVRRARALFGTSGGTDVPSGADQLTAAAHSSASGRQRTSEMAGQGIPAYRDFVQRAVPPLATAAGSDTDLAGHITSAAAVDAAGATRLDTLAAQVKTLAADAPSATTANQQRAILTALRAQLQQVSQVVQTTQQQGNSTAAAVRDLAYPKDAPASGGDGTVQPLDDGTKTPPPHGHDPRYWVDVTKIVEVPEGGRAPSGYVQIGPNQWYPFESNQYSVHPPPEPVKYPLDFHDIQQFAPGSLGPTGTSEYAPGWFAPDPRHFYGPQPAWTPQAPIDIRDIVKVPEGERAPWGFRQFAPGWWAPDVSHDGFPTPPPPKR